MVNPLPSLRAAFTLCLRALLNKSALPHDLLLVFAPVYARVQRSESNCSATLCVSREVRLR
jgi:hypothetical protein